MALMQIYLCVNWQVRGNVRLNMSCLTFTCTQHNTPKQAALDPEENKIQNYIYGFSGKYFCQRAYNTFTSLHKNYCKYES